MAGLFAAAVPFALATRGKLIVGLGAIGLVAVLGVSWRESTRVRASDADAYDSGLRALDRALVTLELDVLKARHGIALAYDDLEAVQGQALRALDALEPPDYLRHDDRVRLAADVAAYRSSVVSHLAIVDDFKRHNSVIDNAAHVLPSLVAELDAWSTAPVAPAVGALLQSLMYPTLEADAALGHKAAALLVAAEADPVNAAKLRLIARHMAIVAEGSAVVDEDISRLAAPDLQRERDRVAQTFTASFVAVEERQDVFRVVLLVAALGLLGAFVMATLSLRRTLAALRRSKETLEQSVLARTREVEERSREVEQRGKDLEERSRRLRMVLDHVSQGLIVVDRDGVIAPECSKAFKDIADGWMPKTFADWMASIDPGAADWMRVSWLDLFSNVMPVQVVVHQMPLFVADDERCFDLGYFPIQDERGEVTGILVSITNASDRVRRERSEREGRDLLSLFELSAGDSGFVRQTLTEIDQLTETVCDTYAAHEVRMRALHTLKGLWRMMGAFGLAEKCHYVEHAVADSGSFSLPGNEFQQLIDAWQRLHVKIAPLFLSPEDLVVLSEEEIEALLTDAGRLSRPALRRRLRGLVSDPADRVLSRYAHETLSLALRMRKEVNVVVTATDVRLPRNLRAVWPRLVHVIRNAIDHGIQGPDARRAIGKPERGTIELAAREEHDALIVEVKDDGTGVDWPMLRAVCASRGIAVASDLDALFADGVSTKTEVTEVSGRGIGMADVRDSVQTHGGTIEVLSASTGTTIRMRFPLAVEHIDDYADVDADPRSTQLRFAAI